MAVLTALLLGTLSVASAQSYQYITTNNLPAEGLQDACKTALTKNITCSQATSRFIGGRYYRPEDLARVCTSSCRSALGDYHNGVAQACGNTSYAYDANNVRPVAAISYGLLHNYELACLNNNNQWCNSIVFNKALQADPTAPPDPGLTPNNATVSDCDLCLIKSMKLQAESALEKSPEPAAHYSSLTAKCKVTNLPLSSSTLPTAKASSTITSATPSTTCAGSTYQVKSGDTCRSIAVAQKIGVGWLVNDNPAKLGAYCAGFKDTLGSLCVANTCKTYTVKTSDTCKSIAKANNVTAVQLISWNPFLNEGCGNLDYSKGDSICISKPGKPYVEPPTPPVATSFTTAAPVPTNVARNTTSKCGKYYTVVPNDYCNLLCVRFQLTLDDFLFLNPAVNINCTNLYAQESYCVAPVGKITDYPGHPGYVAPITEKPPSAYTAFPKATYTFTAPNLPKKLPIANQTRTECYTFVDGTNLQADYKAAFYRSACEMYMQIYHVSAEALQNWNPSLDPSSASCKFDPSYRYCMVAYDPASVPMTTAKTISDSPVPSSTSKGPTAPAPTQSGQPSNCNKWFVPKSGDSCDTAEKSAGITDAQFHAWNPAVSADCTQGFWADTAYCVGVSGGTSSSSATSIKTSSTSSIKTSSTSIKTTSSTTSSKTSSKATTTTQAAAPSPTQPNSISSKCNKYAKAVSGSSCYSMAQDNGITLTKLGLWNTVLGTDGANCNTQYWLDYYYCVGVSA